MAPKRTQSSPAPRAIAADMAASVKHVNKWRDTYNPLRTLTIARIVQLLEAFDRGEMADVQWTYRAIERQFGPLNAIISRRLGAVSDMDWDIRRTPERRSGFDETLAEEQSAMLREAYDRLSNLGELIEHLAMAEFRGFALAGRPDFAAPGPVEIQIVDPWNAVRDGSHGAWKYNPDAMSTSFAALPEANLLPPESIISVTCPRPVNHFALPLQARCGLAEKDWTAFLEIYGIPRGVVLMPRDLPQGQESTFAEMCEKIATGQPGALPFGSDYKSTEPARGVNPFRDFLNFFTEQLVLVGTGGRLTMLTESGSGTLAGGAHADTFNQIARAQARRIAEALQRTMDAGLLAAAFPGKPALAYFALDCQADPARVIEDALKLSQAGYQMDAEELEEKTGYKLEIKPPAASPFGAPPDTISRPSDTLAPSDGERAGERGGTAETGAPASGPAGAGDALDELETIKNRLAALREGMVRNGNQGQPRDSLGKWDEPKFLNERS